MPDVEKASRLTDRLHIIGITRYSVVSAPESRRFRETMAVDYETACRRIWSDERMGLRSRLFSAMCLPSMEIAARKHADFLFIVVTSSAMPQKWKDDLREKVAGKNWCQIVEAPAESWLGSIKPRVKALVGDDRAYTFRLDDDDALSADFVETVLSHQNVPDGTVLSFDRGLVLQATDAGRPILRPKSTIKSSMGMGIFTRGPEPKLIYQLGNHTRVDERAQVVHVKTPSWILGRHATNDSVRRSIRLNIPTPGFVLKHLIGERFSHIGIRAAALAMCARVN
jgi:Putative rhamnosyl transferase